MRNHSFLADHNSLLRQAVAAWILLTVATILSTITAALLRLLVQSDELAIALAVLITLPALVGAYVSLHARAYHVRNTPAELVPDDDTITVIHDAAPPRMLYLHLKRALDLAVASPAAILLTPAVGLIALAIKLDSPGPVFVAQDRVRATPIRTPNGTAWQLRRFRYYTFRTTEWTPDVPHHSPRCCDPTYVGHFLHAAALDYLPQLWSIVLGHMSLVGPRPRTPSEVSTYDQHQLGALAATPGQTGLAQVSQFAALSPDDELQLDLRYIQSRSVFLDLRIIGVNTWLVLTDESSPTYRRYLGTYARRVAQRALGLAQPKTLAQRLTDSLWQIAGLAVTGLYPLLLFMDPRS